MIENYKKHDKSFLKKESEELEEIKRKFNWALQQVFKNEII